MGLPAWGPLDGRKWTLPTKATFSLPCLEGRSRKEEDGQSGLARNSCQRILPWERGGTDTYAMTPSSQLIVCCPNTLYKILIKRLIFQEFQGCDYRELNLKGSPSVPRTLCDRLHWLHAHKDSPVNKADKVSIENPQLCFCRAKAVLDYSKWYGLLVQKYLLPNIMSTSFLNHGTRFVFEQGLGS